MEWYVQIVSVIPSDIGVLQKLADLFDGENDKQQAFQYYIEIYRYFPSNLRVLNWLGEYFIELRLAEKAIIYFEKAALVQPEEPKWKLLVGSCYRQIGNYQRAMQIYKNVLQLFPNNMDCLKLLIKIGKDLGLKETYEYEEKLKKMYVFLSQNNKNHSFCLSQTKSASSKSSSRASSSKENINIINSSFKHLSENNKKNVDLEYRDPIGPTTNERPRTSASHKSNIIRDEVNFDNVEFSNDLLPL